MSVLGGFYDMESKCYLSIIIPVYNEEKLIDRCIGSIVSEGNTDYEVIVIDDGSKDKTADYCYKWVERDNRIKYYRQDNSGVSVARNYGIEKSQGDYIMFLDGDDYLIYGWWHFVSDFFVNDIKRNTDVVIFDYERLIHNNQKRIYVIDSAAEKISKREVVTSYLYTESLNTACCKLYKRDLIVNNKICFPVGVKFGEDAIFFGKVISQAYKFVYIPASIMVYEYNSDSATYVVPRTIEELVKLFEMKNTVFQQNAEKCNLNADYFYKLQLNHFFSFLRDNVKNKDAFIQTCEDSTQNTYISYLIKKIKNKYISNPRRRLQYYLYNNDFFNLLYIGLLSEKTIKNKLNKKKIKN